MATLQSIVYTPKGTRNPKDSYARVPLTDGTLQVGHGLEGDRKGGNPNRQLNVMNAATVAGLAAEGYKTQPGALGEQLVIAGIDLEALPEGTQIRIGGARIELVRLRTGCERFTHIQGKTTFAGRLGWMARVVESGPVAVGDAVTVVQAQPA